MYIKLRTRGTNQYKAKGELVGVVVCKSCGAIQDSTILDDSGQFPVKKRVDNCVKCGASITKGVKGEKI